MLRMFCIYRVSDNKRIIFRRPSKASETIKTFLFYPLLPRSDTIIIIHFVYVRTKYVRKDKNLKKGLVSEDRSNLIVYFSNCFNY